MKRLVVAILLMAASAAVVASVAAILLRGNQAGILIANKPEIFWQSPSAEAGANVLADAYFELENVGTRRVRVLSIESGCGCTSPKVEPTTFEPGMKGKVTFQATPLAVGERVVEIVLHTDSSATRTIPLRLRTIGNRKPPFVAQILGDLTGLNSDASIADRVITVLTIEGAEQTITPNIETDLDFLEFKRLKAEQEPYPAFPNTYTRKYYYEPVFVRPRPMGVFVGRVVARDPWDNSARASLAVQGERREGVRIIPSKVVLKKTKGAGPMESAIMIASDKPLPDLRIEVEDSGGNSLTVEDAGAGMSRILRRFTIRLKAGHSAEKGDYNIKVFSDRDSPPINVPVKIIQDNT